MSESTYFFEQFRKSELLSKYSDFDISDILKQASGNDYWKSKQGLWTVISAACNQAGTEYYISMREYIQNLADIDSCNIHALKSISKQVRM